MSRTLADQNKPKYFNGSVSAYVKNKEYRNKYTFTIDKDGNGFYTVDGKRLSEKEFNKLFPIGLINIGNKQHLDSRQKIHD